MTTQKFQKYIDMLESGDDFKKFAGEVAKIENDEYK